MNWTTHWKSRTWGTTAGSDGVVIAVRSERAAHRVSEGNDSVHGAGARTAGEPGEEPSGADQGDHLSWVYNIPGQDPSQHPGATSVQGESPGPDEPLTVRSSRNYYRLVLQHDFTVVCSRA